MDFRNMRPIPVDKLMKYGTLVLKVFFLPLITVSTFSIAFLPSENTVFLTAFGFYEAFQLVLFIFFTLVLEYVATEANYKWLVLKVIGLTLIYSCLVWRADVIVLFILRCHSYIAMRYVEFTVYVHVTILIFQTRSIKSVDLKRVSYLFVILTALFKIQLIIPCSFDLTGIAEILTEPDEIKKYMMDTEKVDQSGAILHQSDWNGRTDPVMFTWYYNDIETVGHVSLGLTYFNSHDGTQVYISHWPLTNPDYATHMKKRKDTHLGVNSFLASDIQNEGDLPNHIIIFKNEILKQQEVIEWLQSEYLESDDYHLFTSNCINVVRSALRAGGIVKTGSDNKFKMFSVFNRLISVIHSTKGNAESVVGNVRLIRAPSHVIAIYLSIIYIAEVIAFVTVMYAFAIAIELMYYYYVHNYSFAFISNYSFFEPKVKCLKFWFRQNRATKVSSPKQKLVENIEK